MTARVAQFVGVGRPLAVVELAAPTLNPGEILVEIELAAICGSDLHTISGKRPEVSPCSLGHEGVGRVLVSLREGLEIGDRVTWSLADSCGGCARCDDGLPQKCARLFKYGHGAAGLDGTYATHIILRPGTAVFPLPESLDLRLAAVLNCALSTGAECVRGASAKRSLVLGGGLLGLFVAHLLSEAGGKVTVVDSHPARLDLAKRMGFNAVAFANAEVDLVVEAAGSREALHQAYPFLKPGGELRLAGLVHPASELLLTAEDIIRRCWTIRGVHNYRPESLQIAVDKASGFAARLTDDAWGPTFPLDQINDAIAAAESKRGLRVFIAPGTDGLP